MQDSIGRRAARALRMRPALAGAFLLGTGMHALGHTVLAGAAGFLTRHLAGDAALMDVRSTGGGRALADLVPWFGRLPLSLPLALAIAGTSAALVKLVGGMIGAHAEASLAGSAGAELRRDVLRSLLFATSRTEEVRGSAPPPALPALRGIRQPDHGRASSRHSLGAGDREASGHARDLASLTSHIQDVERGIAQGVFAEVRAAVQLAPLLALLVWLAPSLATSAVLALLAFGALAFATRRALKRGHLRAARQAEGMLQAADEAVRHAELWSTYGAEARIEQHVDRLGRAMIATGARLRVRASLLSGTSEVLGALALLLALLLVAAGLLRGVERGAIVSFAIAFFLTYRPLRDLVDARLLRARGEESLARALRPGRADESPRRAPRAWDPAPLELTDLVSHFGRHEPVTATIAPGEIVALVGPTGIGKSSLLRVLLGLDPARRGLVHFGGEDLTTAPRGPGARPFAWVPQHAPVLGDTLAANVGLGSADEDEPTDAARRALQELGAESFAQALGDATLITEREISGGERQWIATARALASRLPVLLLDEPTSQLDPSAQERMLAALARLRGVRTVIIVTHRPEPLAIADRIVRLNAAPRDDGEERPT